MTSEPLNIACIGTGTVGRSWARAFAQSGHRVRLYDADDRVARETVHLLQAELPQRATAFTHADSLESALRGVHYVQESGPESLPVKRRLFEALSAAAGPETLFGSSTSTLPGSSFLCGLFISPRSLVVHPTNPPHLVPLVELCGTGETSRKTLEAARAIMLGCGQTPVEIRKEIFGFALNRLQAALVAEALRLVADDVISPIDLDKVITDGLGLRWAASGPFETGHFNASGGYAEYMSKFRSVWQALFEAIGATCEIDDDLVRRIDGELRGSLGEQPDRALAARDDLLGSLRAVQRKIKISKEGKVA